MSKLYKNIKMLLCKEWGISPFEFDKKQSDGEILLTDVYNYILMLLQTEPFKAQGIITLLWGDKLEAQKKAKEEKIKVINDHKNYFRMLAMAKGATENDEIKRKEKLERLSKKIKELQGELNG